MTAPARPPQGGAVLRSNRASRSDGNPQNAALLSQQQAFQRRLLAGEAEVDGATPPGLEVYRSAYRARLAEALRTNYPVLYRVVGDDVFDGLAAGYIAAHPSGYRSIRWFGDAMSGYLAARGADLPHPSLPDLARFEWAISLAFDGPDAEPVALEALASIAPEAWATLRLHLHPTVRTLDLDWAVETIWRQISADSAAETEPPHPLAHTVRVWRRELTPCWRSITTLERDLLAALAAGADFGTLCEHIAATSREPAQAPQQAVALLQGWLADGLVIGLG